MDVLKGKMMARRKPNKDVPDINVGKMAGEDE